MMFVAPAVEVAPAAPMEQVASLAGDWRSIGASPIRVDYRFISNGSSLVERWRTPSGRETMTVYFVDKGAIFATHYCGQGNQATLRADASPERMDFRFVSATGVDPGEGVLVGLTLIASANRLRRIETYRTGEKDSVETIEFERVTPAQAAVSMPSSPSLR